MKTNLSNPMIIIGLFLIFASCLESYGQDSLSQKSQMLDLKLQLLDSKLELLDTKIKLWEAKPKELDIKLTELNSRINSMDFEPKLMTKRINEIDSMFRMSRSLYLLLKFNNWLLMNPNRNICLNLYQITNQQLCSIPSDFWKELSVCHTKGS